MMVNIHSVRQSSLWQFGPVCVRDFWFQKQHLPWFQASNPIWQCVVISDQCMNNYLLGSFFLASQLKAYPVEQEHP